MMSLVNGPMYPMKRLCREEMYVLYTALSTIFLITASMLLLFYVMGFCMLVS